MLNDPLPIVTTDAASIHFLSFKNALISATRLARKRIWICCYVLNSNLNRQNDPVTLFLSLLKKRRALGCDVRFIIDNPQASRPNFHCNKYFMRRLMEMDIPFISPHKKTTSHAKCILIDDKVLFIGSHNLAKSSLENRLDCTVELHDKDLISGFAANYLDLWQDQSMESFTPGDLPVATYYG